MLEVGMIGLGIMGSAMSALPSISCRHGTGPGQTGYRFGMCRLALTPAPFIAAQASIKTRLSISGIRCQPRRLYPVYRANFIILTSVAADSNRT